MIARVRGPSSFLRPTLGRVAAAVVPRGAAAVALPRGAAAAAPRDPFASSRRANGRYGGIESGWRDRDGKRLLEAYARKQVGLHRVNEKNWSTAALAVRRCAVQSDVGGEFHHTYYVAPPYDATHAHGLPPPNFVAPFCGRHHWQPLE